MAAVEFILMERMVLLGLKGKPAINHALSVLRCPIQLMAVRKSVIFL